MIDILIFAVIAGFLVRHLYGVLGQQNPEDAKRTEHNIIHLASRGAAKRAPPRPAQADPVIAAVLAAEPNFQLDNFLRGCERAFAWVIRAFAQGDKERLQGLLSPEVFQQFSDAIDARTAKGEKLEQTLDSLAQVRIEHAVVEGRDILITVRFVSVQTLALWDAQDQLLEGSTTHMTQQNDLWTFCRQAGAKSPLWQVVATQVATDA